MKAVRRTKEAYRLGIVRTKVRLKQKGNKRTVQDFYK